MKNLKLFAALVAIFTTLSATATHYAGAEIFYEHVPGSARAYHVTLIVYGDLNGTAALQVQESISYSSSCHPGGIVNIQNSQGATAGYNRADYIYTQAYPCAPYDPNDPNSVQFYSFTFEMTVTLPVDCNDWVFSWENFARNNAITNIQNPGGQALHIEALLNSNFGPNSSPQFTSAPVKQFCVKQPNDPPFPLVQTAIEVDGDSIVYELAQPQGAGGALIPWVNGYSNMAPISSWTTPTINQKTATFFFAPNTPEVDVLKIVVKEYRFDANSGVWIFVGNTTRDLQIPVLTNCNSNAENGPSINTSLAGFSTGSYYGDSLRETYGFTKISNDSTLEPITGKYLFEISQIEYNCFDNVVTLKFDDSPLIYTPSISEAKDEFRILGPDGVSRPIVDITFLPQPGSAVQTNEIYLKLHKPLDTDGNYLLQIKKGSDGNTLQDECGFQLPPNQIMLITVINCPSLDYNLDNLTVVNDRNRKIDWSIADPNYLQPSLFNYWQVGMTVGGATYVRTINDINARSFLDTEEFFPDQVDHQNFEYWVQLVQNSDFKAPANNNLITIKLRDTITFKGLQHSTVDFGWNAYNAWSSSETEYQMWWAECNPDSSLATAWEKYEGQDTSYFYNHFDVDNSKIANDGLFVFRVDATNNQNPPPAGWISESNWKYVLVKYSEIPDVSLPSLFAPNVFTPNDDNQNDKFYITAVNGAREYEEVKLSVFNRWGQLVYEDEDFSSRNNPEQGWDGTSIYTGKKLADGVYYYTAKFRDPLTNKTKDLQGSVTMLGS